LTLADHLKTLWLWPEETPTPKRDRIKHIYGSSE
jgi:hypothetical protein